MVLEVVTKAVVHVPRMPQGIRNRKVYLTVTVTKARSCCVIDILYWIKVLLARCKVPDFIYIITPWSTVCVLNLNFMELCEWKEKQHWNIISILQNFGTHTQWELFLSSRVLVTITLMVQWGRPLGQGPNWPVHPELYSYVNRTQLTEPTIASIAHSQTLNVGCLSKACHQWIKRHVSV